MADQPSVCPHGCRRPIECLRYDQGGSIPADCLLEQRDPDASSVADKLDAMGSHQFAKFVREASERGLSSSKGAPMIVTECQTCGSTLTKDGCPYRMQHALAIAKLGFTPDMRGAPSRPGGATSVTLRQALEDVVSERARQDGKWGRQDHGPDVWLRILVEEVGEVAEAINESWTDAYRKELIEVAAVAVAAVEALDRSRSHV